MEMNWRKVRLQWMWKQFFFLNNLANNNMLICSMEVCGHSVAWVEQHARIFGHNFCRHNRMGTIIIETVPPGGALDIYFSLFIHQNCHRHRLYSLIVSRVLAYCGVVVTLAIGIVIDDGTQTICIRVSLWICVHIEFIDGKFHQIVHVLFAVDRKLHWNHYWNAFLVVSFPYILPIQRNHNSFWRFVNLQCFLPFAARTTVCVLDDFELEVLPNALL